MKKALFALMATGTCGMSVLGTPANAQETNLIFYGLQMEQLEFRRGDTSENLFVWDGDAFVGTDEIKLRWLGEGEVDLDSGRAEKLENRLVLQTPISDFFDAKAGVRLDSPDGPGRWYGLIGVTGLAPQWFEIDADLFFAETGDVSARLDIEYELLFTNKLILTPSVEINVAFSDDREVGVGSGVSDIELGLRLSYDVLDRAISPYIGVGYERKFGRTKDFALAAGEDPDIWFITVGTKILF